MSKTKQNERRKGTADETSLGENAANATVDLFNSLMEAAHKTHQPETDALSAEIERRVARIRTVIDFDADGLLHFQFFSVREGALPRLVFDVIPENPINA